MTLGELKVLEAAHEAHPSCVLARPQLASDLGEAAALQEPSDHDPPLSIRHGLKAGLKGSGACSRRRTRPDPQRVPGSRHLAEGDDSTAAGQGADRGPARHSPAGSPGAPLRPPAAPQRSSSSALQRRSASMTPIALSPKIISRPRLLWVTSSRCESQEMPAKSLFSSYSWNPATGTPSGCPRRI
jgi:hypothetical protein